MSKSDHELLALAAKAAEIKAQYSDNYGDFSIGEPYSRGEIRWNPITDDGDALRLAVKLGIEFYMEGYGISECVWANEIFEWTDGDALSATRRAIVRAAATIGETLP